MWFKKIILICLALTYISFQPSFSQTDSIPALNKKIISLVKQSIGKKVGRGECWDLAEFVLDNASVTWEKPYGYGRKIDPKKEAILPGDIIQFEKVQIRIEDGNKIMTESYQHHTAVVYEVLSTNHLKVAQQNTSQHGKKVSIDALLLDHVVKGKVMIYRVKL